MADLQAELARFEAELGGAGAFEPAGPQVRFHSDQNLSVTNSR